MTDTVLVCMYGRQLMPGSMVEGTNPQPTFFHLPAEHQADESSRLLYSICQCVCVQVNGKLCSICKL